MDYHNFIKASPVGNYGWYHMVCYSFSSI